MLLSELLSTLGQLAKENDISMPLIVGGFPRDRILNVPVETLKDIDITTGDSGSLKLATLASTKWPESDFRLYDDNHSAITFSNNIRLDFSNNFKIVGIEEELKKDGIEKPTDLEKELYSRDFTINTLLQPMDLNKEPFDLTKKAKEDIENKIIRTPINPALTIGHDPRRILRALKLSIRFDFAIEKSLEETIIKYRGNIKNLTLAHIKKQINEMLNMDADKTLELLTKYKLLPIIPLSKLMQLEVVKRHMVQNLIE